MHPPKTAIELKAGELLVEFDSVISITAINQAPKRGFLRVGRKLGRLPTEGRVVDLNFF